MSKQQASKDADWFAYDISTVNPAHYVANPNSSISLCRTSADNGSHVDLAIALLLEKYTHTTHARSISSQKGSGSNRVDAPLARIKILPRWCPV
mmetsp:Transcript_11892/g.40989  ORF Transcript_11892/g.40989 Transcript_11892/m.40989 type:complete len:94 (-) Transcript_11892:62-343(-)